MSPHPSKQPSSHEKYSYLSFLFHSYQHKCHFPGSHFLILFVSVSIRCFNTFEFSGPRILILLSNVENASCRWFHLGEHASVLAKASENVQKTPKLRNKTWSTGNLKQYEDASVKSITEGNLWQAHWSVYKTDCTNRTEWMNEQCY